MELKTDPKREGVMGEGVGIPIRACDCDGHWGTFDVAELERDSVIYWLRSRGGVNLYAENVVLILLGHEPYADESAVPKFERD